MNWREELAWAAGVFSDSGYFYRRYLTLALILPSRDPEMLGRFQKAVLHTGEIKGPYKCDDHATYNWLALGHTQSQAVIAMLNPWFDAPRKRKAKTLLEAHMLSSVWDCDAGKVLCDNGHIRHGDNITHSGQCKECQADAARKHYYSQRNATIEKGPIKFS